MDTQEHEHIPDFERIAIEDGGSIAITAGSCGCCSSTEYVSTEDAIKIIEQEMANLEAFKAVLVGGTQGKP